MNRRLIVVVLGVLHVAAGRNHDSECRVRHAEPAHVVGYPLLRESESRHGIAPTDRYFMGQPGQHNRAG